ncbi:MAG TPA: hypothetical protein DCG12_11485 [Planctomycetaceae bacterium]|nr:hypothetical protein [Planctomycetaceae bacterium]
MESGGTQGRAVFSPDRRYVVVFYEGKTARLWDVVARRRIGQLLTGDAQRNEWSSDSRTFYSLTRRGTLRSWDVEESQEKLQ